MIRNIMRDIEFLKQKAESATAADAPIADDLIETLRANHERCVGMAANMIGVNKAIIVFEDGGEITEMFNPVILRRSEPFDAEEGCLSLAGARPAKRYRQIKVQWQMRDMKKRIRNFSGFTAQIIQHEIDHLNGVII